MNQKLFFAKLGLAIVFAFFISTGLNRVVFIADSPTIRPDLGTYIVSNIKIGFPSLPSFDGGFLTNLFGNSEIKKQEEMLQAIPFTTISKGVYAKSTKDVSQTVFKVNEVDWIENTYDINGKQIKIRVPAGQQLLPKEALESAQ